MGMPEFTLLAPKEIKKNKKSEIFLDTKLPKTIHEVQIIEINQYEKKKVALFAPPSHGPCFSGAGTE